MSIKTVNEAFDEFMYNSVDLDKDVVAQARKSRDNLLDNINEFDNDNFFHLWREINIQYGSFARKTKCRKLDDIDLMIGISGEGATYDGSAIWNDVTITASTTNKTQVECSNEDGSLNSTKVINAFKKKLEKVREYSNSDLHKNGQAVTLTLKSKEWNFDIVPCFHTVEEADGRSYYLIPNGNGGWLKTDPNIDKEYLLDVNKTKDGKVLELIRLCKKWNKIKHVKTIPSYLFETLIVDYCSSVDKLNDYIDVRFIKFLEFLRTGIYNKVEDMKGIQGNINTLDFSDKISISNSASSDYKKAKEANEAEFKESNQQKAINIWRDIFGDEFPEYDD